jgi:membrane protein implicated in regulation of membrane protease activity
MTTMAHFPVNHHLRPLYRTLAALAGIYMLVFGIVAFSKVSGRPFFTQDEAAWALGLRANPAFAVLSMVAGAVVLVANVIGRNIAHLVNTVAAVVLIVAGMAMLLLMQTSANIFAFSMVNCIVTFILALVIGTVSLYDRTGSSEQGHGGEQSQGRQDRAKEPQHQN